MSKTLVFTGSYSRVLTLGTGEVVPGTGKGITVLSLNTESGKLQKLHEYPEESNPTYLAADREKKYLYANHELKEFSGLSCACSSSYRIHAENGGIEKINTRISGGTDACNIAVSPDGRYVVTANYKSGSVCVYPREPDGSLGKPTCFLQHKGSSVNKSRQSEPHPHQIRFDKSGSHLLVPDLGADQIVIYEFDAEYGYLIPCRIEYPKADPGDGPRHCVFNAAGDRLYLVNEMANKVHVFRYNGETAETKRLQSISTLPENFSGESTTAALKLHPNGKFLYASNRGHDSLAIFRVDAESGLLTLVDTQPTGGKTPRDFGFNSSGEYLIVGNQDSDNLVVFKVDADTGKLTETQTLEGIFAVTAVLCVDL